MLENALHDSSFSPRKRKLLLGNMVRGCGVETVFPRELSPDNWFWATWQPGKSVRGTVFPRYGISWGIRVPRPKTAMPMTISCN